MTGTCNGFLIVRVVSLEEELRSSEEMVRTLQDMSQQPGSSAARGRVDEGRGVEEKMEVVARAVSEAAIAKGRMYNTKLQHCVAMVIATVVMVTCEAQTNALFSRMINIELFMCYCV